MPSTVRISSPSRARPARSAAARRPPSARGWPRAPRVVVPGRSIRASRGRRTRRGAEPGATAVGERSCLALPRFTRAIEAPARSARAATRAAPAARAVARRLELEVDAAEERVVADRQLGRRSKPSTFAPDSSKKNPACSRPLSRMVAAAWASMRSARTAKPIAPVQPGAGAARGGRRAVRRVAAVHAGLREAAVGTGRPPHVVREPRAHVGHDRHAGSSSRYVKR